MKILLSILCFVLIHDLVAQNLRIRLYDGVATKELQCVVGTGEYLLEIHQSDGTVKSYLLPTFAQGRIKVNNSNLQFFQGANLLGQGIKITLIQGAKEDFINWSVPLVSSKVRAYESDFELTVVKGQIQVINHVDLDTYLEGVVSSEGGSGHHKAYYQAQAIISRTYALAYQNRHQKEGYALCDRVHCQAYLHKRSGSALIDSAVYQTHQMVLKDANGNYFPTFFSANCGGQTCLPQDVWNEPISGLYSFVDTFCIHTKQANWQKRIPLTIWLDFLTANYDFPIEDSTAMALLQDFQSINRSAFYLHPVYGIPMRDLRQEFKLKSSYFNAVVSGQEVLLTGKGFGHGVGLCQEGAMQMAKKGYNATQILEFYYPGAVVTKDAHTPKKE